MFWPDFWRPSRGFSTFFFLGLSTFLGFPKSLRSRPKGPLGPLGPLKKSLRSGIHARNPPKWSATHFISCPEPP